MKTTEEFTQLLIDLEACRTAREWAAGKTWPEVYQECHRADWLIWLYTKLHPERVRERTLVAGHCANTVRHLMEDERSRAAVDAAIAYGEGRIEAEELHAAWAAAAAVLRLPARAAWAAAGAAAWAATDAAQAAAAAAARAATDAAQAAAASTRGAAADAAAWAAASAASTRGAAAIESYQRLTADICREYLPLETWEI